MPDRPFYPPAWQIPGLLDGRATRIVVPLKVQPYDGYEVFQHPDGHWIQQGHGIIELRMPFAPGDVLLCKEAWARLPRSNLVGANGNPADPYEAGYCAIYAADWGQPAIGGIAWRSPVTMPAWAVRLRLRVTEDVRVCRVGDLTETECEEFGTREPSLTKLGGALAQAAWSERQVFARWWQHRYARKPGLAFEKGPWAATAKVERVEG